VKKDRTLLMTYLAHAAGPLEVIASARDVADCWEE